MFTVAGVTGKVGSACANALLAEGQKIRVIVRNEKKGAEWKARGAEVVVGDIGDAAFLTRALTGVEGAFLLLPPDFPKGEVYEHQKEVAAAIGEAVKASKVPHVVLLSSIGAQHPSGTGPIQGLHHAEKALEASGAHVSFIRAASFMENHAGVLGAVTAQGVLPHFMGDDSYPYAQVATRDIGELAARALRNPPTDKKKIYNLAGPKEVSTREVAETLGRALGKAVQTVAVPLEHAVGAMTQAGVPEHLAKVFAEMYDGARKGLLSWEEKGAELVRGKVSLGDFVKELTAKKPSSGGATHQ